MLRYRADIQRNVKVELIVHPHRDVRPRVGSETRRSCGDRVAPGRQGKEMVRAIGRRSDLLAEIGLYIDDTDLSANHDRLCTIMDHARDRTSDIRTRHD